ncbi:Gfo/Idh/MocA family oxidoreductase [Rhodococcus ruber]|uniref:Gfo/Idh/MocA family oxidoreductase n=1 Tax=Rhodococcus ruber TaxID=1830 RepID=A0ABT4MEC0_9NOCA|nr:Gfo/Idh/MocA family oxidoreductase [Rhodococcus ruber]MCZ4519337.1 Gfo/Idh/MocA family oxidoreductase [Rhodococcus ruber]
MKNVQGLSWGLVGASTIAREFMIDAIRSQPGSDVAILVSSDRERGERFAASFGIPRVTTSLDDLLEDDLVDAVYISTTNQHHASQAIAAIRAGKHVLCEKPLAMSLSDARSMVDTANKEDVVLGTNHHLRGAATIQSIRNLVADGAIGTPLYAGVTHVCELPSNLRGWRLEDPSAGGGVAFDLVAHDADTLRYIFGSEIVEVMAIADSHYPVEQGMVAVLKLKNGILAHIIDTFNVPHGGTGISIHGTRGSIHATDVLTQQPVGTVTLVDDRGEHTVDVQHHGIYEYALHRFTSAARGYGIPLATGEDGLASLAVTLAARTSAGSGRSERVQ